VEGLGADFKIEEPLSNAPFIGNDKAIIAPVKEIRDNLACPFSLRDHNLRGAEVFVQLDPQDIP
jgi:hypothetical protein